MSRNFAMLIIYKQIQTDNTDADWLKFEFKQHILTYQC